jgi:hypothetical protein
MRFQLKINYNLQHDVYMLYAAQQHSGNTAAKTIFM